MECIICAVCAQIMIAKAGIEGDDEARKQANCRKQDLRTESKLIQAEFKRETLFVY